MVKKGPKRFLSKLSLGDYSNRPKMQFECAKVVKSYEQIERNRPKCQFLVKNDHFLVKNDHFWSKITIFWSKITIFWSKMVQKWAKYIFSQNFHWSILVLDHKCSFYKRNQQNPLSRLGSKKSQKDFCQNFYWVIIVIDHKCKLNMQNQ